MSRLGITLTLLFLVALIGFASMVHWGGPRSGSPGLATDSRVLSRGASAGSLTIPVQGIAPAALHDDWAEPRGDGTRLHHAIDIMAPVGTPVLATADGLIEKLFTSTLGGLTIYERSADGSTVYYYAHLDRYAPTLVEGQRVKRGQTIAAVGASGDADPGAPHLHFEVHRMAPGERWWQGAEINPYLLLRSGS